MNTPKYNFIADNCNKVVATTTAISAGTKSLAKTPAGELYILNQKGQVITTAAIAAATKKFMIAQVLKGQLHKTPLFDVKSLSSITSLLPQTFKGMRTIVGKFTGVTSQLFAAIPNNPYSLHIAITNGFNEDLNEFSFSSNAMSPAAGELNGVLFTSLAKEFYKKKEFGKAFRCVAHTNATAAGTVTISIEEDEQTFSYTGTVLVGDYLAYTGTNGDGRIQPRGVYRVTSVNSVNGTGRIAQPWIAESLTTTAVSKVPLADTDDWAFFIEAKAMEVQDFTLIKYYPIYYKLTVGQSSSILEADITSRGTNISGVSPIGHHLDVAKIQVTNQPQANLEDFINTVKDDRMYTGINLHIDMQGNSLNHNYPTEGNIIIQLERDTVANTEAEDTPTLLTNLVTGTGRGASTAGAFINSLNLLAVAAGLFQDAANTKANGGNCLTASIDY